jgi:hypothetical protein
MAKNGGAAIKPSIAKAAWQRKAATSVVKAWRKAWRQRRKTASNGE